VRLFKKLKAFSIYLNINGGFYSNVRHFESFKDIFRKLEAFDYKCKALIRNLRLFEDSLNGIEAFIK
jgi:hypothetical protein